MIREMNMPPAEFQEQLTYLGGVNKFDEPNFRIWWGQYGHGDGSFRAGGIWSVDEQYFRGYRDLLKGSGEPCWCLGQWHDASEYGSPESYYLQNLDLDSGLQILGEYAYSGRIEILFNLRWHEMIDDKLVMHSLPLTTRTFDAIIPMILAAQDLSVEKRRAAFEEMRAKEEGEKLKDVERHLMDKAVPFSGAVSFGRQGIRSTVIDQKMLQLQRMWSQLSRSAAQFSRTGLQTR